MYSILVLCTHNNCRSQMAEGIIRYMSNNSVIVASAGILPGRLDNYAVQVMREVGIDISKQHAKTLDKFLGRTFDLVLTLCDIGREHWVNFPGQFTYLHWEIEDPTTATGTEEEVLERYRFVRDELIAYVRSDLVWRVGDDTWTTSLLEEGEL